LGSEPVITVHAESCRKEVGAGWESLDMTEMPGNAFVLHEVFPHV
jgi:hypothetical protein